MDNLDAIVILLIVCAGGLAFVVLYNLANINITERVREIATIKVLGFYDGETSAYIYRKSDIDDCGHYRGSCGRKDTALFCCDNF